MASSRQIVQVWFDAWESGRFTDIPITDDFRHFSPFGVVEGKASYLEMVEANRDKFLGHRFIIHEGLYESDRAAVRYTAVQGDFSLEVSEWYQFEGDLIREIRAYYHIGEIGEDRQLKPS